MKKKSQWFLLSVALVALLLAGVYQIPVVKYQLEWRLDKAAGIVRGWLHPADTLAVPAGVSAGQQTPLATTRTASALAATVETQQSREPEQTATPQQVTATPRPIRFELEPPFWEKQDWNNCGPATLALALRYYDWDGDQFDISDIHKPDRGDKNVNIDELAYYVRNNAGWLAAEYRVGGDLDLLKSLIAAGYPVLIEEANVIAEGGGGWAAHYLLLTGYDDTREVFITQDTYVSANRDVSFTDLDANWKPFNRVYLLIYPPAAQAPVEELLGEDWEEEQNRQTALARAREELALDDEDVFAWFNLGTNLVALEDYQAAAQAYDRAILLGLPWRFTRYQFGPYIAYFNAGRFEDVIELTETTLARTPNSEEALLWHGWANYQLGDVQAASLDFQAAYALNPSYHDAHYALEYLGYLD